MCIVIFAHNHSNFKLCAKLVDLFLKNSPFIIIIMVLQYLSKICLISVTLLVLQLFNYIVNYGRKSPKIEIVCQDTTQIMLTFDNLFLFLSIL